ncbi:MAG: hypothetical protein LCH96_07780 [Actinobacteria bacterium]|nr:hypothetical protein [Actinomycetota bacterium]
MAETGSRLVRFWKRLSVAKKVVAVSIPLVLAALGTWVAVLAVPAARITYDNGHDFILRYLDTAPTDPRRAYDTMTTTQFRDHTKYSDYKKLWGSVQGVKDVSVNFDAQQPNVFRTSWVFIDGDGRPANYTTHVALNLVCASDVAKFTFGLCPVGAVRIDSSVNETADAPKPTHAPAPDAASDLANVGTAPKGFRLPKGLTEVDKLALVRPCSTEMEPGLATLKGRRWSRVAEDSGEEHLTQVGAFRFVNTEAAVAFMDEVRNIAQNCDFPTASEGGEIRAGHPMFPAGDWEEAVGATSESQVADGAPPEDGSWGALFLAARNKNFVAISWSTGLGYRMATDEQEDPLYDEAVDAISYVLDQA